MIAGGAGERLDLRVPEEGAGSGCTIVIRPSGDREGPVLTNSEMACVASIVSPASPLMSSIALVAVTPPTLSGSRAYQKPAKL